jgi:hypothetical protein
MPSPHGVISIRGDIKRAYDCDKESCEVADRLTSSVKLQELKESLVESLLNPVMPDSKASKRSTQLEDGLNKHIPFSTEEPSKATHIGKTLDPK